MRVFRMITGLLALFPRRRSASGSDDLRAENARLQRMVDELRSANFGLVRAKERWESRKATLREPPPVTQGQVREARARENLDRIRSLLRGGGVNVSRAHAPLAIEQLIVELSLLREKVGSNILREEGLDRLGTPGRDCGWESQ